ncbi:MAG: chemotaxis protein, partial [Campylobacterota bacterium]|nr:chemotaxis protein [Campylobacterota bacterium]
GKEIFGEHKEYAKIDAPHKVIHKNVLQNMNYIDNKNVMSNRDIILENFTNIEEASAELFTVLDDILQKSNK